MIKNGFKPKNWEIRNVYAMMIKDLRTKVGKKTQFKTLVTEKMLDVIKKRYLQLCQEKNNLLDI